MHTYFQIPCELPSDKQIDTSSFLSLSSPTSVAVSSPGLSADFAQVNDKIPIPFAPAFRKQALHHLVSLDLDLDVDTMEPLIFVLGWEWIGITTPLGVLYKSREKRDPCCR